MLFLSVAVGLMWSCLIDCRIFRTAFLLKMKGTVVYEACHLLIRYLVHPSFETCQPVYTLSLSISAFPQVAQTTSVCKI